MRFLILIMEEAERVYLSIMLHGKVPIYNRQIEKNITVSY